MLESIILFILTGLVLLLSAGAVAALLFRREIRSIRHRNSPWRCLRCGRCCRMNVILKQKDIERLKEAGYREEDFVERKCGIAFLKKKSDGDCVFLDQHEDENGNRWTECTVYSLRPDIGRRYPEFKWWFIRGKDHQCPGVGKNDETTNNAE